MEKSFYYLVDRDIMFDVFSTLNALQIPFAIERINGATAVIFPDLPVRQFDLVHKLFGGPGERYL